MNYGAIDYHNKKAKWTIMKYVSSFDLLLRYVEIIERLGYQVGDKDIDKINEEMEATGIYRPRASPSRDTQYFKIIQILNNMFAYRGDRDTIVFTPLCKLLLKHQNDMVVRGKIVSTMLSNLPYAHPYNKMDASFNLFPYRLIFKLLLEPRLDCMLFQDDVFYLVAWTKEIDPVSYEELVAAILRLRKMSVSERIALYMDPLPKQDALANMLHEVDYLFEQMAGAGIVDHDRGEKLGCLCHGGFGRNDIPNVSPGAVNYKPTGRRAFRSSCVKLRYEVLTFVERLMRERPFDEKPRSLLDSLGTNDYILRLWNDSPTFLLQEIGELSQTFSRIDYMSQVVDELRRSSLNGKKGDCYKFERAVCDALNEFSDVQAEVIAKAGTTDVECLYLTLHEKFDVEAKSTQGKLVQVNTGRLAMHREKVRSKYTIVVTPHYAPAVLMDIKGSDVVILKVGSLCNYMSQMTISENQISYEPIYDIIQQRRGSDISHDVDDYILRNFGFEKQVEESRTFVELPLYSLRAACGRFRGEQVAEPEGVVSVEVGLKPLDPNCHVVVKAEGDSMLSRIKDGDFCVVERADGADDGKIVLLERGESDLGHSAEYALKVKKNAHTFTPLNRDKAFKPIVVREGDARVDIRGVFKGVLTVIEGSGAYRLG